MRDPRAMRKPQTGTMKCNKMIQALHLLQLLRGTHTHTLIEQRDIQCQNATCFHHT